MSISGPTLSTTFTYDAVGNQTAGLGRTISWTSYNMPASITQGARTVSFQHDDNHQRIKQISTDGNTLYIKAFGVTAELFGIGTGAARWNDYLSVGNVQVGMRVTEVAACQSGALSGAAGAAVGPFMGGMNNTQRLVASAVVGGAASVAGGGSRSPSRRHCPHRRCPQPDHAVRQPPGRRVDDGGDLNGGDLFPHRFCLPYCNVPYLGTYCPS